MSKTRVNRTLPSVKDLFLQHSAARYLTVNTGRGFEEVRGSGFFHRGLRHDAVAAQAQKYR